MNTIKIPDKKQVQMIAHRGVSKIEAENTIAAFIAAGNRSYFGIETDVHKTADGGYILTHDDNTKRVTGEDYVVERTPFETLRSLKVYDFGKTESRSDLYMPSLAEYIELCKKYEKKAVLELKNSFTRKEVGEICKIISDIGYIDGTIFITFDINNLHSVRHFHPEAVVQLLIYREVPEDLVETLAKYSFDLDAFHDAITPELVAACHAVGAKVNVWTVDTVELAEKMITCGVDYITTNICE